MKHTNDEMEKVIQELKELNNSDNLHELSVRLTVLNQSLKDNKLVDAWLQKIAATRADVPDYDLTLQLKLEFLAEYLSRSGKDQYSALVQSLTSILEQLEHFNLLLTPFAVLVRNIRGITYMLLKKYSIAIEDFSQCIRIIPDFSIPHEQRAQAYMRTGNYEECFKELDISIRLRPSSSLHNTRGVLLTALQRYDEAIESFSNSLSIQPNVKALVIRGNLYNRIHRYSDSLDDYHKAQLLDPSFIHIYSNRFLSYMSIDRSIQALADLCTMVTLETEAPKAHSTLVSKCSLLDHIKQQSEDSLVEY